MGRKWGLYLTIDGKREEYNVNFILSSESLKALKYNWKTKNIHVKSRTILIRVKSRLDPFSQMELEKRIENLRARMKRLIEAHDTLENLQKNILYRVR